MAITGETGDASPKFCLGGLKRKRPPIIAAFSKFFGAHRYRSRCATEHLFHFISTQNQRNMHTWMRRGSGTSG